MKNEKQNKNLFLLFLVAVFPFSLSAQSQNNLNSNGCFTDQLHQKMLDTYPDYNIKHRTIEHQLYQLKKASNFSTLKSITTQSIPVVVHIIHQNGDENIADQQVFDAIQYLNEAFANTGFYDPNTGVNTEIEFCMAIRDPQNNSSNGVNRIQSPLTNVTLETQDFELKELLLWNPFDYLNIWVVNEITSTSSGSGVLGYAYLPAAHGTPVDGIVMDANYFGSSRDDTKVLVHEVGHYLGLYHTFEGGCTNDDCQIDGDRVCDTPPDQSTAPVECGAAINTCTTDEDDTSSDNPFRPIAIGGIGDQNDLFINYMDYGHLPCYSAFTIGQKERMNNALSTIRQSLLESLGCQTPCPFATYNASFSTTPTSPLAGDEVSFTNTSDSGDTYEWSIDDQFISNNFNIDYTFVEEGAYIVKLEVRDTVNNCKSTIEQVVDVNCEGAASFTTSSTQILPGETINFVNTGFGNNNYEWFLDGVSYSTDNDIDITFTTAGYFTVYLVGMTDDCLNFSSTINIVVGSCSSEDKSEMHWYFGGFVALDFNSGEPVAVTGSQLNSLEGACSVSGENGELLFYTDGVNIWDTSNSVMPNGSGLMGGANISSWSQAIIIPNPNNSNQYYVFTCDEYENNVMNGIQYSIVDMTLNGGLGDVTDVKNIFLTTTNNETMVATYHGDGQNAWLVVPDHEVINAYLIDATGVGPAISFSDLNYEADWGFGKFSNSGKKMVFSQFLNDPDFLVMLDFDNVNGVFSNPIQITTTSDVISSFEFSADDSKLYGAIEVENFEFDLFQFDLSLTTGTQISNSKTFINNLTQFSRFLLAPNDRIYVTTFSAPYLGVINNPNELGIACDFVPEAVDLNPATNILSIPRFIRGQRFMSEPAMPMIELGPDKSICNGLTTVLNAGNGDYDFLWQDGSINNTYTAWLPGTYWVTASNECGAVTDSVNILSDNINLVNLGDDLQFCNGVDITLDAGIIGDFHLWQDGTSSPTFVVSEPGTYWVEVSTQAGCYEQDSIIVELDTTLPILICPINLDTIITFGIGEVLLNPGIPEITESCPYTFANDFTNTNDATANYPAGSTTALTWTVTDVNGNSATCNTDITVNISTGISFINSEITNLIVYPNPSTGLFVLEDLQNKSNDIQLSVYNMLGQKVYEEAVFLQGKMHIDLSEQAIGTYFLHWSIDQQNGIFKLIKKS